MNVASPSEKPRALITGFRGFTGHYLAGELKMAGYEVFGTAHASEPLGEGVFAMDLCNRDQVKQVIAEVRPDVVAHLAAISFVAHGDVDAIYRINVVGTRNILEGLADLQTAPRAVLLAGSGQVYGNSTIELIDESTQLSPASDYAVSKLAMEYMARLWMDRLPIFITRPFNYTGVGQAPQFLLPKIIGHFQRGERFIELGNIDVERDFSDVRMVARSYAALLAKAPAGEVFNVCSGKTHSLKEVLAMMSEIAGYEIEVRVNPAFVRTNEVKRLQGDASKLLKVVGNVETIPLHDTLRWMYANA